MEQKCILHKSSFSLFSSPSSSSEKMWGLKQKSYIFGENFLMNSYPPFLRLWMEFLCILIYALNEQKKSTYILRLILRPGSCTSELQLKVNCWIKFGLAQPTVGRPAQIFSYISPSAFNFTFQMQFTCTWSGPYSM